MKVTDEMVERAMAAAPLREPDAFSPFIRKLFDDERRKVFRAALEAALADIPDPEQVRAEIMDELAYGRSVERQMLDARIAELEAKLEKVRAWVEGHAQQYILAELTDYLDGKEQP